MFLLAALVRFDVRTYIEVSGGSRVYSNFHPALSLLGRAQATQRTQRSIGQRQGGPCGPTYRTLAIFTRYRPHTRYRYTYTGWMVSLNQASILLVLGASGVRFFNHPLTLARVCCSGGQLR